MADLELNYGATFEQTLQLFTGLSSDEIWEIQRLLVRRVRVRMSESLSPEGKEAMKQAKKDMEAMGRRMSVTELASVTTLLATTLVTERIDMGSRQTTQTSEQHADSSDGTTRPEGHVTEIHDQPADVEDTAGVSRRYSLEEEGKVVEDSPKLVQEDVKQEVREPHESISQSVENTSCASRDISMVHETPETDIGREDNSDEIAAATESSAPAEPRGSSSQDDGDSTHHTEQQSQGE